MTRIAIIGAGSTVFTTELVTDILLSPGIPAGTFALVDIDSERLDLAHHIVQHLIELAGTNWQVQASTDRVDVLGGCDYIINTIEVAGLANVRHDYDIPFKYGVDQCIGDTIGPGGIFKALRTLPAWLDILADAERMAPNALVMNYTILCRLQFSLAYAALIFRLLAFATRFSIQPSSWPDILISPMMKLIIVPPA